MRRMRLREIMLSLKFIALENLCSQHRLFQQYLSLPTTGSHGTKDHSLLSTNLRAPAGESRQSQIWIFCALSHLISAVLVL